MREDGMRFSLDIVNEKGLHARASAKFVETVERFDARARVSRDGMEVSGDSIMGLMMLAAARGTSIDIVVDGTEAAALADALRILVGGRFGEPN
jgi:phosphocarrier protein